MTVHLHISTTSQDCDGRYDRESIEVRTISGLDIPTPANGVSGTYTLDFEDGTDGLLYRMTASVPTDEGYTAVELTECEKDCDLDQNTYRDHTAEMMGY